jgi:RNA polymerase sigma-70 factor, ECF subfamily
LNDSIPSVQSELEAHKSQLGSYLFRLTAHKEDAEDLLHDTYNKAVEKWNSFKNRSSLKTWIFAIATNLAKD